MEALCESDLILTQIPPTVSSPSIELLPTYGRNTTRLPQPRFSASSQGQHKGRKEDIKTFGLEGMSSAFSFFFFFPYSVSQVTSCLTLLDEVPSIRLLWMDCISVAVTQ